MLNHRQRLNNNVLNLCLNYVRVVTIRSETFVELSYSALMWFNIINRSCLHEFFRLFIDGVICQVHELIIDVMAMFHIDLAVRLGGKPN